jgi:starch synthase (maltosyl-transferring)
VKDYYALNPLFADEADSPADELLRAFVVDAEGHGLSVMMDLVVNHSAKDSLLVEQHPAWFKRAADGSIVSPHAIDPADATKLTVWGDLAEIDYDSSAVRTEILEYWKQLVRHYAVLGFHGFRCDAAYKVPAEVWAPLIAEARQAAPGLRFFAETLGCRLDQVEALAGAGFDYLFNSVKWWDLRAPWALEQYELFRRIAPSVGFPESHDTERLAVELPPDVIGVGDARKFYLLRYALAACFASGVLMPIGYEFGFRRGLDVVHTRPSDWEEPQFDLSGEIAAINGIKAGSPALNEEGPQYYHADDAAIALVRSTNDATAHAIFAANASPTRVARIDLAPLLAAAHIAVADLRDATAGFAHGDSLLTLDLRPLQWRVLQTT